MYRKSKLTFEKILCKGSEIKESNQLSIILRNSENSFYAESYGVFRNYLEYELGIPKRTIEDWASLRRNPPAYVKKLIEYYVNKHEESRLNSDLFVIVD